MKFFSLIFTLFLFTFCIFGNQQQWWHLTTDDGLVSNRILSIYQAKNDDIWISTDKGINRYSGLFEESSLLKIEESSLLGTNSNKVIELPSGQILARGVSMSGEVYINIFDGSEWSQPDFFKENGIRVSVWPEFAVNSSSGLWVSTWSNGIVKFDGQTWEVHDLDTTNLRLHDQTQNPNLNQSPKGFNQLIKSINCACGGCSRLTIYACGCDFAQEAKVDFEEEFALGKSVEQIRSEYLQEYGSEYSAFGDVSWLVQTPDGKLWTETSDMGDKTLIASFNGQKWIAELNTDNSLLDITETVFATSSGKILIGTTNGLLRYDPDFNMMTDLQIGQVKIRQIYESLEGVVWVATNEGVFRLGKDNWKKEFISSLNAIFLVNKCHLPVS